MQSVSVFFDIAKFAEIRSKNADVSRTQLVCHVIHNFLDLLWIRHNCANFYHCRICVTGFKEGGPFCPPSVSIPEKAHPELG